MDGVAQWVFFKLIFDFLDGEIEVFRDNMLGEMLQWVTGMALILLTVWILIQGYRIVTGQSRDSMMALVTNSLRSVLIVMAATTLAFGSADIYKTFTDGMPKEIMQIVTGDDESPADTIDRSLSLMQGAMVGIDLLSASGDPGLKEDKDRAIMLTGIGVAGPAVVGGALLLMYKVAMALVVGLGPLFILSLLFEQTKQLFSRWLYYGIGTLFSLAVLSFMVAVAMKMVLVVATAFAAQYLVAMSTGLSAEGVNSMAMQQGGVGLVMTVLLVIVPPMAASFFQGNLGNFSAYSQFGVTGRAAERPPQLGGGGYAPPPTPIGRQEISAINAPPPATGLTSQYTGGSPMTQPDVIKKGSNAPGGS